MLDYRHTYTRTYKQFMGRGHEEGGGGGSTGGLSGRGLMVDILAYNCCWNGSCVYISGGPINSRLGTLGVLTVFLQNLSIMVYPGLGIRSFAHCSFPQSLISLKSNE